MKLRGPWGREQVASFLESTRIPLRLSCNGASGHPLLASLWYVPQNGRLWCATQRSAHIAELLERDPRCAFEVAPDAPPYRGVRGRGRAILEPARGGEVLETLIARYLDDPRSEFAAWLRSRADRETAIAIEPQRVTSWDFRERMGAAA
jgi:hypothetical protein